MWSHDYFEKILHGRGFRRIAGVDEVGRGALAGPVVAAAVIFEGTGDYSEFRDSKTLSRPRRDQLAARIEAEALGLAVGLASETEVDRLNVLQATRNAMREAVGRLRPIPDIVLVDGFWLPGLDIPCMGIVDGDALCYTIAAASILAKVRRDGMMGRLAAVYPQYGFERNMGYGTPYHTNALAMHGPCPCHRRTFGRVGEAATVGGLYG